MHPALILDGRAHPDVLGPCEFPRERRRTLGALGEHLEAMPPRPIHRLEHGRDVLVGYLFVEQVAHRVHKDEPPALPLQRQFESLRPELQVEAVLIGVARHPPEAFRERLRVAMGTTRADLRATRDRIPGRLRPLDRRTVAHGGPPMMFTFAPPL